MGSKILNENVINVLFVDKQMQISKENVNSGFRIATNLLKCEIMMFIQFFSSSELIFRAFYLHHDVCSRFDNCMYTYLCKKGLTDNICSYRHSYSFYIRISIVFDKRLRQLLKGSILVSSCRFLFLFANPVFRTG